MLQVRHPAVSIGAAALSPPKRPSHLFALRPEGGAVGEIGELRDAPGWGGSPIRDEHLHATLFWLGYDGADTPALIARARDAAGAIGAPSFRVVLDRLVASRSSLLLLPTEPLDQLHDFQRRLATALGRADVRADPRWRFHPHVSLRRGPPGRLAGAIHQIAWTATEFILIRSLVAPFRHQIVDRWPLVGGTRS